MCRAPTRDYEKYMLSSDQCLSPGAIETDKDKHEALGVEGRQAEEER